MGFYMTKTKLGTSTSSDSGRHSRRRVILAATTVLGWQLLNARRSPRLFAGDEDGQRCCNNGFDWEPSR